MCRWPLRIAVALLAFFGCSLYGNVIFGEKVQNDRGRSRHGYSNGVANPALQDNPQYFSGDVIGGAPATSGPRFSVNNEFSWSESIGNAPIRGDVSTCGERFNGTKRKTAERYRIPIERTVWAENYRNDFNRQLVDCFASGNIKHAVSHAVSKLKPPYVQLDSAIVPTTLLYIDSHFPWYPWSPGHGGQSLLKFSDNMRGSEKIPILVDEKSSTVDKQIELARRVLLDAQNGYDGVFDGPNRRDEWIRLLFGQGGKRTAQKQQQAKHSKSSDATLSSATSGSLTFSNDGRMYGCFVAESSASEVNISCPQIDAPIRRQAPQHSTRDPQAPPPSQE